MHIEYKTIGFDTTPEISKLLKRESAEGWELVAATKDSNNAGLLILRRDIDDPSISEIVSTVLDALIREKFCDEPLFDIREFRRIATKSLLDFTDRLHDKKSNPGEASSAD